MDFDFNLSVLLFFMTYVVGFMVCFFFNIYFLAIWIQDSGCDLTSAWLKVMLEASIFVSCGEMVLGLIIFLPLGFMSACHFCCACVAVPLPVSFELGEQTATLGKNCYRVGRRLRKKAHGCLPGLLGGRGLRRSVGAVE